MTIELPADLELALRAEAERRQVNIEELVERTLRGQFESSGGQPAAVPATTCPDPWPQDYFAQEEATYQRHKEMLDRDHWGKVVLLRGEEFIGVFETWEDALADARRRFANDEKFMVHDIPTEVCEMFIGLH
jgi:hypothetical protein